MSPWFRRLLVGAMLLWTGFTGFAGWTALRDGGTSASATDVAALHDVVTAEGRREVRPLTPEELAAVGDVPDTAAAAAPAPPVQHPFPDGAAAADAGGVTRAADNGGALPAVPARVSKGVVVLDPGHGRGDPGATHYLPDGSGRWDVTEAESNQRNAELIRDRLLAMGYDVYLTREGPGRGPGGPLPLQFITSDLYARVALAKAVDADLYLAIHGNGAVVKSISGPETWYCGKHEEGAANRDLALAVQQAMMNALHEYGYFPPDRGIKEDAASHHSGDFCQFVVTREAPVPAALLEFLFLSNDADAAVLVDDRSHVLMAEHVARAIDGFLQNRGDSPPLPPVEGLPDPAISPIPADEPSATPVASCPVGVRC
jgi:N-acetylmuramoyl-L-alanine amidase